MVTNCKEAIVAAPDYLRPISVAERGKTAGGSTEAYGLFNRPSITGLVSASLDLISALAAGLLAIRLRNAAVFQSASWDVAPHVTLSPDSVFMTYILWFGLCLVFFMRTYGLYRPIQQMSGLHELRMTVHATIVAGLTLCGTLYLSSGALISRLEIGLTLLITFFLLVIRRMVRRRMMYQRFRAGIETRNVLIVGAGRVAHALRNHLNSLDHLGFRFKGFVAITPEESESGDPDICGEFRNCLTLARTMFVDEIFLSVPADKKLVLGLVQEARTAGIDVRVVPDLYDGLAWNAPVEYVGQFPTIPLHRRDFPIGAYLVKRAMDLTLAAGGLVALSPLLLAIAIWVKLDSPGPVFYRAKRIGRKGRTFDCYKFRTMVTNADKLKADLEHMNERKGILFKIVNDPRITRVGAKLRKYSLDELPQLYNVVLGDMSLVGPRPPIASEVEQYELSHLKRLDVLPGLTGLWQVEARQDPSFDSYISLDTAYVENWSLALDIKILVRTVGVVIMGTGS
jgi:exopolysaccharide biosynthesis polyprenyl glycosylphosphotransferase